MSSKILSNTALKEHIRSLMPSITQARVDQMVRHLVTLSADLGDNASSHGVRGFGKFVYHADTPSRHPWLGFRPASNISKVPSDLKDETPFRAVLIKQIEIVTSQSVADWHADAMLVALAAFDLAFSSGKKVTIIKGGTFSVKTIKPLIIGSSERGPVRYQFQHRLTFKKVAADA